MSQHSVAAADGHVTSSRLKLTFCCCSVESQEVLPDQSDKSMSLFTKAELICSWTFINNIVYRLSALFWPLYVYISSSLGLTPVSSDLGTDSDSSAGISGHGLVLLSFPLLWPQGCELLHCQGQTPDQQRFLRFLLLRRLRGSDGFSSWGVNLTTASDPAWQPEVTGSNTSVAEVLKVLTSGCKVAFDLTPGVKLCWTEMEWNI